jgi:hypothetical protein
LDENHGSPIFSLKTMEPKNKREKTLPQKLFSKIVFLLGMVGFMIFGSLVQKFGSDKEYIIAVVCLETFMGLWLIGRGFFGLNGRLSVDWQIKDFPTDRVLWERIFGEEKVERWVRDMTAGPIGVGFNILFMMFGVMLLALAVSGFFF